MRINIKLLNYLYEILIGLLLEQKKKNIFGIIQTNVLDCWNVFGLYISSLGNITFCKYNEENHQCIFVQVNFSCYFGTYSFVCQDLV